MEGEGVGSIIGWPGGQKNMVHDKAFLFLETLVKTQAWLLKKSSESTLSSWIRHSKRQTTWTKVEPDTIISQTLKNWLDPGLLPPGAGDLIHQYVLSPTHPVVHLHQSFLIHGKCVKT